MPTKKLVQSQHNIRKNSANVIYKRPGFLKKNSGLFSLIINDFYVNIYYKNQIKLKLNFTILNKPLVILIYL